MDKRKICKMAYRKKGLCYTDMCAFRDNCIRWRQRCDLCGDGFKPKKGERICFLCRLYFKKLKQQYKVKL